jgi:2-keto-4-pentenoate hydratase/2-oxohepta-3-ene-1,7-dioic acid hydratase in catechol pathway
MKLASFRGSDPKDDIARVGIVIGDSILDLSEYFGAIDMLSLIHKFSDVRGQCDEMARNASSIRHPLLKLNEVKLAAPVTRPGKIICLAGNYRDHITESGFVAPESDDVITQQLFLKPSTAIIGNDDEILIGRNNVKVGWETELAVIISKGGKNIPVESAFEHVFGYTILNDVSERGLNSTIENRRKREMDRFLDWLAGKWFDTFAPCGPWLVTADEIVEPHDLEIKLTINGELRQHGNTRDMIFRIPEQIAYASSIMTLEPGDIISTGTPAGAGLGGASNSLQEGDALVCEIEKIGTLKNRVRYTG